MTYRYRYLLRCRRCGGMTVRVIDVATGSTTPDEPPVCGGVYGPQWGPSASCRFLAPDWETLRVDVETLQAPADPE